MTIRDRRFQRKVESFTCLHCGAAVAGNGYTNHCPQCLWSRHVDVNPGDRAEDCLGLMRPVGSETKHGEHRVIHRCEVCGAVRKNKLSNDDRLEALLEP